MSQVLKSVSVDGKTYTIVQFAPKKALKIFSRLTKLLGVPMATLMQSGSRPIQEVLPIAIGSLVERMDEDSVIDLMEQLMSEVNYDGSSISFDAHFQGKLGLLFKLATEVVKHNFEDFFGALASVSGVTLAKKKKA